MDLHLSEKRARDYLFCFVWFLAHALQNLIGLDPTILYSGSNHSITSRYMWQPVNISKFPPETILLTMSLPTGTPRDSFIAVMDD